MHKINFSKDGSTSLSKLPIKIISQIKNKIIWLSENAEEIPHIMLKGSEFKNIFKIRTGDYRILYELDNINKIITIIKVGHRKDIYKV